MTPTDAPVAAPKKLMTVDEYWDFCQRPENADRRTELIRGEVVDVSRPTHMHGIACYGVTRAVGGYAEQVETGYITTNDSGVVLDEMPGTVVGPDVAYYTHVNETEDVTQKWGDVPPLLAVEVLSPNDKMSQVNEKIADYLNSGVKLVWLVDHEERKVTVYRPGRTHEVVKADATLTGGDELPGFSCLVSELFRTPGQRKKPSPPPSA